MTSAARPAASDAEYWNFRVRVTSDMLISSLFVLVY
jgi:hypothetical protein